MVGILILKEIKSIEANVRTGPAFMFYYKSLHTKMVNAVSHLEKSSHELNEYSYLSCTFEQSYEPRRVILKQSVVNVFLSQ